MNNLEQTVGATRSRAHERTERRRGLRKRVLAWRGRRYVKDFLHHCPSLTACSTARVVVVVLERTFMVVAVVQWSRSAELPPGAPAASCDGEGARGAWS